MRIFDINEAKKRLSQLVDQAARGESFVISKSGKPLVRVCSLDAPTSGRTRRLGFLRGQFQVPEDFDRMGQLDVERLFRNE
ncbi:MAG TPA: type II toxin-antitoxin system prevent-host-death family antitoxin [Burkholderiales bacterium]|nr:type II toxin-antitoxin system prevent-host-death family antitoxin [Burkholderiales bacterium]